MAATSELHQSRPERFREARRQADPVSRLGGCRNPGRQRHQLLRQREPEDGRGENRRHSSGSTWCRVWSIAAAERVPTRSGSYATPDGDRFHSLDAALEAWVEQGSAPAEIIATKYKTERPEERRGAHAPLVPVAAGRKVQRFRQHGRCRQFCLRQVTRYTTNSLRLLRVIRAVQRFQSPAVVR